MTSQAVSWDSLKPSIVQAISSMSPEDLEAMEAQAAELVRDIQTNQLSTYRPYPKQMEFHAAGATFRERLLQAANQVGKTWSAGMEVAFHATGLYPEWWTGKRFNRPTVGWVAGVTGESTRDNPQKILLGREDQYGTGCIPLGCIEGEPIRARGGVQFLVDIVRIRHVSGGISTIAFKFYEKGREKWQGETLDWVWYDEEPPEDVYIEGLTRTNTTMGPVWITFTPLMGETAVVRRFKNPHPDRHRTNMTLEDAQHYTPEQRKKIEESYPEHEREARAHGIPVLGSGLIFPVARSVISCPAFEVPIHWPAIGGFDFGWDHPTAAVKLRHNPDDDVIYVTNTYRQSRQLPLIHAAAVKPWDGDKDKLPWAWPHDGLQHDKQSGVQTAADYRAKGLDMLPARATFDDGSNGVEIGLQQLLERMQTGRFKVFAHLNDWFEEQQSYHRKDGAVVKEADDLMAATRYAYMMRRYARVIHHVSKDRYARQRYQSSGGGSWAAA